MTKTDAEKIAEAIRDVMISPNVADSNFEPANLVDVLQRVASGAYYIGHAITTEKRDDMSLTHSVIGMTTALEAIADAIHRLADVHDRKG